MRIWLLPSGDASSCASASIIIIIRATDAHNVCIRIRCVQFAEITTQRASDRWETITAVCYTSMCSTARVRNHLVARIKACVTAKTQRFFII